MDNKDLEKRILEVPHGLVGNMDAECITRLTNNFKEPLVRLLVGRGPTLAWQQSIYERITSMWSYVHYYEDFPKYFGEIKFDLDCGILIKQEEETSHNQPAKDTAAKTSPVDAELKKENKRLKARIKELEGQLKEANTLPQDVNAQQRVRMELARLIMEKAGIDKQVLAKWGNKDKAGALMGTMLDITASTCKNYLSDPCLNRNHHKKTVEEINPLLEALGIDIRL